MVLTRSETKRVVEKVGREDWMRDKLYLETLSGVTLRKLEGGKVEEKEFNKYVMIKMIEFALEEEESRRCEIMLEMASAINKYLFGELLKREKSNKEHYKNFILTISYKFVEIDQELTERSERIKACVLKKCKKEMKETLKNVMKYYIALKKEEEEKVVEV